MLAQTVRGPSTLRRVSADLPDDPAGPPDAEWAAGLPDLELGRPLGKGAFGAVFEARHARFGAVAVKVLPGKSRVNDEAFAEVVALTHPNLLHMFARAEHRGRTYAIMELVEGDELLPSVRPPPPPPPPALATNATIPLAFGQPVQEGGESAFLPIHRDGVAKLVPALRQLAGALGALHAAGMIHRDVRPENVLVTRQGRVVLIDYGLLVDTAHEDHDQTDGIAGAPAYMSPDDDPTPASDWYSFGVILFEALTGALPFTGNAQEVIIRKRTVIAPSPGFVVDLPREAAPLDALCVKLLRRAASMRGGYAEVMAALDAVGAG
jgi:serine/threonine protein kinase